MEEEDKLKSIELKQYVTFFVGDETYGVSVMKVQSINEMIEITHVPKARAFIKGVINLRGSVIPVIDMRKKFSLPPSEFIEKAKAQLAMCNSDSESNGCLMRITPMVVFNASLADK